MKITISRNNKGSYYTTLKNNYNGVESKMYMSVQLPRDMELEYGSYDVNCFLSCYTGNDGVVRPKIVVTGLKDKNSAPKRKSSEKTEKKEEVDPFAEFGEEIDLSNDGWLD